MASLLSVNVGLPKDVAWQGKTVRTGIWKSPVDGPARVRRLNIDGDGQGDLNGHGGEQRAVLVYQIESIRTGRTTSAGRGRVRPVRRELHRRGARRRRGVRRRPLPDRHRRVRGHPAPGHLLPVGMRLGAPTLPALLVAHHRPGFYFRVITEGEVRRGRRDRPHQARPARDERRRHRRPALPARPRRRSPRGAVDIPALSPGWQQSFRDLLAGEDKAEPGWPGFRPLRVATSSARAPPSRPSTSDRKTAARCQSRCPAST